MVFSLYLYGSYFFTFDTINRTDAQAGSDSITSPSHRYTAEAYYEPYGGAAGGVNVWVDVIDHQSSTVETISYSDAKDRFAMEWLNDQT